MGTVTKSKTVHHHGAPTHAVGSDKAKGRGDTIKMTHVVKKKSAAACIKTSAKTTSTFLPPATHKRELEVAYGDLDAALHATRCAKKMKAAESKASRVIALAQSSSTTCPRTVPNAAQPTPCATAVSTDTASRAFALPCHIAAYLHYSCAMEAHTSRRHGNEAGETDGTVVNPMLLSFALSNGTWGTFFAEDQSCLEFLPLGNDAKSAHVSASDLRADRRPSVAETAAPVVGVPPATVLPGTEPHDAPHLSTTELDQVRPRRHLLLYANPDGHCFVLAACEPFLCAPALSADAVRALQQRCYPELPHALLGKLACVLRTCLTTGSSTTQAKAVCATVAHVIKLPRQAPSEADVVPSMASPLVLEACADAQRWCGAPPFLEGGETLSGAGKAQFTDVDCSPAMMCFADHDGSDERDAGGLEKNACEPPRHGGAVGAHTRWLVPYVTRVEVCNGVVGAKDSAEEKTRQGTSCADDGVLCSTLRITFGNCLTPYPQNAFYHHSAEVY